MQLEPCGGCQRHVEITESACPFCGASVVGKQPRGSTIGRLSRAAVFAGAALATTACGKKAKQPDTKATTTTQTPDAGVTPDAEPPEKQMPMPYGAPPARRRYV